MEERDAQVTQLADALVAFTRLGDHRPGQRHRPVEALAFVPTRRVRARALAVAEWAATPVVTAGLIALGNALT